MAILSYFRTQKDIIGCVYLLPSFGVGRNIKYVGISCGHLIVYNRANDQTINEMPNYLLINNNLLPSIDLCICIQYKCFNNMKQNIHKISYFKLTNMPNGSVA